MKYNDWDTFLKDLEELEEGTYHLEAKYKGMVDLRAMRVDIDNLLTLMERQQKYCAEANELFESVARMDTSDKEMAQEAYEVLLKAEHRRVQAQKSSEDLWGALTARAKTLELKSVENTGEDEHDDSVPTGTTPVEDRISEMIADLPVKSV